MNILRQFWCWLVGHKREDYINEIDRLYHARCKCCKIELDTRFDSNPFGW